MEERQVNVKKMTLKDFMADGKVLPVEASRHFNGGAFMCCHTQIFAQTGVWIEELVPVFQKLDSQLARANAKTVKALSPNLA
jgi:hypothetical protein